MSFNAPSGESVETESKKLTVGGPSVFLCLSLFPLQGDCSSDFRRATHSTKSRVLWQWGNRLVTLKCRIFKIGVCWIESFMA